MKIPITAKNPLKAIVTSAAREAEPTAWRFTTYHQVAENKATCRALFYDGTSKDITVTLNDCPYFPEKP